MPEVLGAAAVRTDAPAATDPGAVVRGVGAGSSPGLWLANGVETAVGIAAVQVLAANATNARTHALVQNTGTANIRVGLTGVTAVTGLRLAPGDTFELINPNCPQEAIFAIREGAVDSIAFAAEAT